MRYLVILDDGHGNETEGKRTPLFTDSSFMKENTFNDEVVNKIYNELRSYENIDLVFTASEKRDVSLDDRCERANNIYDDSKDIYDKIVLVSVHANALNGVWGSQNGTSTYHYPTNEIDKAFATVINNNLVVKTKLNNRGVLSGDFQILREVKMTACLCECAFMDNLIEAKLLMSDEFRQACAEGIINGLKEYFGMNKQIVKVDYSVTPKGTYQLCGDVKDLNVKIVDKSNLSIEEPYCVNGTFFWHDANNVTYSTSILYANGKTYKGQANHLPYPQSVFIIYKDNTVAMKQIKNIEELDLTKVRVAIGGVGLRNTLDSNFKYNPAKEGFIGDYADVLAKRNKTVIGYNKKENKIYILCRPNIFHSKNDDVKKTDKYYLLDLVKDCEYDIAMSVDGGGSTFMNNVDSMVLKGDGRRINNIIGFNL